MELAELASKAPPHSKEAEQAVIGPIMRFNDLFDEISELVTAEDFYFDCHQRIFRTVQSMHNRGLNVDVLTVGFALHESKQLAEVGGAAYLAELFDIDPTGMNAVYFAKAVRQYAERRALLMACQLAIRSVMQNEPTDDILASLEDRLNKSRQTDDSLRVQKLGDIAEQEFKRVQDARDGIRDDLIIPTGISELDEAMGGIRPGVTVVGARTSVGKTAFGLQIQRIASAAGIPSLIVSLEMDPHELLQRQLSSMGAINLKTLIVNPSDLTEDEVDRLHDACREIQNAPMFYINPYDFNLAKFQTAVRRAIHKFGVRVVVLDYVQLMNGDNVKSPRIEQLTAITRGLKNFQRRYGIALYELAQLNRQSVNNDEPKVSDFRECGSIEQDADNAILLWRTTEEDDKTLTIGCHIAKQRNGPLPKFNMTFRKRIATFENYHGKPVDVR